MIRLGKQEDLPELLRMSEVFYKAAHYHRWVSFMDSKPHIELWLQGAMQEPQYLVAVSEHEGRLDGMLLAACVPIFWNPNLRAATELVLWVDTDTRQKGVGGSLIEAFKFWAKENNCAIMSATTIQKVFPKKAGQLFRAHGFELEEKAYFQEVK